MSNLSLGDKAVGKLSCLSDHYVYRQLLPSDNSVVGSLCRGCDWNEICHKIMLVIKENEEK